MNLTEEQNAIVAADGDVCINACAGSGKTTTLKEYAKARPKEDFLYLCFNRGVREQAEESFPDNVEALNIHSLAFKEMRAYKWKIAKTFSCFDVVDLLNIKPPKGEDKSYTALLGQHILNHLNMYLHGIKTEIFEVGYEKAFEKSPFVQRYAGEIQDGAEKIYKMMVNGETPILHNIYLKLFQLSKPKLHHHSIMCDEIQDLNGCMMSVFTNHEGPKIGVGDVFQSIYGFLHSINAIDYLIMQDFQPFHLTESFRFRQDVADLAQQILHLRKKLGDPVNVSIKGVGDPRDLSTRAFLARSNLSLVEKAADLVATSEFDIHFEGNLNSYIFSDGVGLYDIFFLFKGQHNKIKNKVLSRFRNYWEFKKFVEDTKNSDQLILCNLVEKYDGDIFNVMKMIKDRNVDRDRADIILSNIHKAKGMEYDIVELADDFIHEKTLTNARGEDKKRLMEEINILYVAATRTKNKIIFPQELLFDHDNLTESRYG